MTEEKKMLFSQDALKKLLWPLIIEQFLAIAMGMADTVMAASCGEAVVSGIWWTFMCFWKNSVGK